MEELFEARRRVRQFQASRASRAQQLDDAIASGRLKVIGSDEVPGDLAKEAGIEVATLVRAAQARNGIYLHPVPLHRLVAMRLRQKSISMSNI